MRRQTDHVKQQCLLYDFFGFAQIHTHTQITFKVRADTSFCSEAKNYQGFSLLIGTANCDTNRKVDVMLSHFDAMVARQMAFTLIKYEEHCLVHAYAEREWEQERR